MDNFKKSILVGRSGNVQLTETKSILQEFLEKMKCRFPAGQKFSR